MRKLLAVTLAVIMCFSMIGTVSAAEMKFTDVKPGNWFYDDVKSAVETGLINGKSETTYAPNANLTYAEAFKLAACMNQLYIEGAVTLKNGTPWYKPYIDYCSENDFAKIYAEIENANKMNAPATREAFMYIFSDSLPEEALPAINDVPDDSIPDYPSSRSLAGGVYKLYRAGILTGVDAAHNCNPDGNVRRSEVAAIITRMMDAEKRIKFDMGETEEKPAELKIENLTGAELEIPDLTKGEVKVKATGGEGNYTYKWEYNYNGEWKTVAFAGGDQYTFTGTPNTDTLEISATVEDYSGNMKIRCTVTDESGTSVTSSETHVQAKKETSDSSSGGRGSVPVGKSEYMDDSSDTSGSSGGGRGTLPVGKNQYMDR